MSNDRKELLRKLRDSNMENDGKRLPPVDKEDSGNFDLGDVHIMPAGYPEFTSKSKGKGFELIIFLVLICIIFLLFKHK